MYDVTRQDYKVSLTHPTGFHKGDHILSVRTVTDDFKTVKSVSGSDFGCGKDQLAKADGCEWVKLTDADAIKNFLAEHACTVIKVRKIKITV